jgi:hypothetical protein
MTMHPNMKIPILTAILFCFGLHAAQSQTLDSLPGKVKTVYTAGFKTRAETLQKFVEAAEKFYEKQYPKLKFSTRLNVLAKKDWENQVKIPYGIPYAWQQNIYVGADKQYVAAMFHTGVKPGDEQLAVFDALVIHELGHYFLLTLTNTDTKLKWLDEFLASYFMNAFTRQANFDATLPPVGPYKPEHQSLADFEAIYLGVGPQNYDWYQRQFLKLGYTLYPKLKLKLIDAFLANDVNGGKKTDPLTLLRNLAPAEVDAWIATMNRK